MLYGLIYLTWFDVTTLTLTFTTIVIVQLLNAAFVSSSSSSAAATAATTTSSTVTTPTTATNEIKTILTPIKTEILTTSKSNANGKFSEKQKSLQRDDSINTNSGSSTPLLATARDSFDSGCILPPSTPPPVSQTPTPPPPPLSPTLPPSPPTPYHQIYNCATPLAPFLTKAASITETSISAAASSSSSPSTSSPSISSSSHTLHTIGSSLSLSDEYQEDEDTISLENLFPCDQTEIYASKKISFIIDELIQTEQNYVNNLRRGLGMYGRLHKRQDLPEGLQGTDRRLELLGNIDEILQLHDKHILPLMLRNQRDLKLLFDEFAAYFNKNHFYCYVIYAINEKTSQRLRSGHRDWFQNLQTELNDKLGIDSFLVQPIQRLTRYPLLLQQFISEFYKSGISCKPVLMSVCKLETRMRRWLEVVNQSQQISDIEDISEPSLLTKGQFRRATEFDAYHHRSRKKYRAKVFLFDHCLLCTEVRKRRLVYRAHYDWLLLDLQSNSLRSVTLLLRTTPTAPVDNANANGNTTNSNGNGNGSSNSNATTITANTITSSYASLAQAASGGTPYAGAGVDNASQKEYDFNASEAATLKHWLHTAHAAMERARIHATQRGTFSLPMDLVLGVLLAIWLIWIYL